jgi:DNA invertase Pin-like site-specific DNA recombinase
MRIGYARVSKLDQNPDLQLDALNQAGCEKVYIDHATGKTQDRPEWNKMMDHLRKGDTLVVWRLDRAGRSLRHLIDMMNDLQQRGVNFRSLTEGFTTGHFLSPRSQHERRQEWRGLH